MDTSVHMLRWARHHLSPRQTFADLFAKPWMDPFVPFVVLVLIFVIFGSVIPHYFSLYNFQFLGHPFTEFGLVCLAMGLSLMSGGIDLSVGSMFALLDFVALALLNGLALPVTAVIVITVLGGALLGAVNGLFIGFLRTRPFLTTLVTLLVYRGAFNLLSTAFPNVSNTTSNSTAWAWLGSGNLSGVPSGLWLLVIVCAFGHLLLSRSRIGRHLFAVGANRRAARHAGISNERVLFFTYVCSGAICAIAAILVAARLSSTDSETGSNFAFESLAAVMIGGVSLAGGKGSVGRVLIGGGILFFLTNGLVQLGYPGALSTAASGLILIIAIGVDAKWSKHKLSVVQKAFVNPIFVDYGPLPDTSRDGGGPYALNDKLSNAEAIGLNSIEGPEDIILDRQGRLYAGSRQGWIYRFSGPNFQNQELFAKIGGRPLGLAFDKNDNLIVCVSGMGLYGVKPSGEIFLLTDETNRNWFQLVDDSRLKLSDDLDIAPDGKIYFSEGTTRFDLDNWPVDGLEGRGTGRLVCYDPATKKTHTVIRNVRFCNGVCMAHDNKSLFYCETFGMRLMRYWLEGPSKGKAEVVINDLPGAPDNINRGSNGGYWLALVGMRSPVYDIAMKHPKFRIHMIKRLPPDEWLIDGMNNGCIVRLDGSGQPIESFWDAASESHATLTSMREDRGYLYLGGLENNRIGRIKLSNANPEWVSSVSYWGVH